MIRSCQGDSLTNVIFSKQNTADLKVLPNHSGIYACRLSPNQSIKLWKDLSLRLTVTRFKRSYHVQFPLC